MNTQIQEGVLEPCGYCSLATAVGAKLLVEVPSWTGVFGVRGMHSSPTRALAGAPKLVGPAQMRWFVFGCFLVWGFVSCALKVRFGLRCCI